MKIHTLVMTYVGMNVILEAECGSDLAVANVALITEISRARMDLFLPISSTSF